MVPYVDMVIPVLAMNVMRVLLIVLHVCMMKECDGARVATMLVLWMEEGWLW